MKIKIIVKTKLKPILESVNNNSSALNASKKKKVK
jgi:hypothetical protein